MMTKKDPDCRQELFERFKYDAKTLIETGTQHGAGCRAALAAGFAKVVSFEINTDMAAQCMRSFQDYPQVMIFAEGSLHGIFASQIEQQRNRVVYWLDAHRMDGNGKGYRDYPLGKEVQLICEHTREDAPAPIVLCDDVRLFTRYGTSPLAVHFHITRRFGKYKVFRATSKSTLKQDVLALVPEELEA